MRNYILRDVDPRLWADVERVAKMRGCSKRQLINSALLTYIKLADHLETLKPPQSVPAVAGTLESGKADHVRL